MNQPRITDASGTNSRGRIEGRVKFYLADKGFGFIWDNDNDRSSEVFMHCKDFVPELKSLSQGDIVSFEVEQGRKGLQAVRVEFVRNATVEELREIKEANRAANANKPRRQNYNQDYNR